jgi:hypothetical protein
MSHGVMPSLDGRLYRAALSLYPAGFRREHGDEMARDFDEARGEAAADGGGALWILRLLITVDLVRTFGIQWLRSGFPAIGMASILVTLALAEGLATLALRARFAPFQMPADPLDAEVLGLLLLAVMCVMLIAMTIVISLWVNRPRRRGRR